MRAMGNKKNIAKAALTVTRWVGSPLSLFVHTIFFGGIFYTGFSGILPADYVFAVTTNILSIEAIYLAIFIQMTINYQAQALEEVQEDVEEIQENVGEIQEDVGEIQEDVDELQEDVEELSEEEKAEEVAESRRKTEQREALESIEMNLQKLMEDITHLKATRKPTDAKPLF
jgi:hypothetical protein